jgi:TonB family protein
MFNVVVDRKKRSVWSARTVAVSAGAHLVVLAMVVTAANAGPAPVPVEIIDIGHVAEKAPPPPPKPAPPPPVEQQQQRVVVKGQTLELKTPTVVPPDLPPVDPNATRANPDDYTGEGRVGNEIGTPEPTPQVPVVPDPPLPDFRTEHIPAENADVLPQLLSPREAQRMLERVYPHILRDAGVAGRTTVLLVIDKNGQVEPGSITVQETTHDAFRDAAVRAAQRFRFRPARLNGQPVAVSITIPI